jgi:hypothetical protein
MGFRGKAVGKHPGGFLGNLQTTSKKTQTQEVFAVWEKRGGGLNPSAPTKFFNALAVSDNLSIFELCDFGVSFVGHLYQLLHHF